jgi:hypothetical protein
LSSFTQSRIETFGRALGGVILIRGLGDRGSTGVSSSGVILNRTLDPIALRLLGVDVAGTVIAIVARLMAQHSQGTDGITVESVRRSCNQCAQPLHSSSSSMRTRGRDALGVGVTGR